jgi:hypothetical protein
MILPVLLRRYMGTSTGGLIQALLVPFPVEVPHVAHLQSGRKRVNTVVSKGWLEGGDALNRLNL